MNEEIWKPVVGYEGLYEVSNLGRVRPTERTMSQNGRWGVVQRHHKACVLKQYKEKKGYVSVTLFKNNKWTTTRIHNIVADAFIPNPENKPEIDHINTIRTDNRLCNLRRVTRSENRRNPITRKRRSEVLTGKYGTPVDVYDIHKNFIGSFPTMILAAKAIDCAPKTVWNNLHGRCISKDYIFKHGTLSPQ